MEQAYELAKNIYTAVKQGCAYTIPALPMMQLGFKAAKNSAVQKTTAWQSLGQMHQAGAYEFTEGFRVLIIQQGIRVFFKSTILAIGLPYATKHHKGYENLIIPTALTFMDFAISPLEMKLTCKYTKQPPPTSLVAAYRAAILQALRHGFIWFTYSPIKAVVDSIYRALGGDPDTHLGAAVTSVPIASGVGFPMQPAYVVEAKRQNGMQYTGTNKYLHFFKNTGVAVEIYSKESLRGLFRGFPATTIGLSGLAYVANRLVILGKQQNKNLEQNAEASAFRPK